MPTWQLFALAVLIWGTTWIAITFQLGTVAPEASVTYRFLLAGVVLYRGIDCAWLRREAADADTDMQHAMTVHRFALRRQALEHQRRLPGAQEGQPLQHAGRPSTPAAAPE